MQNFCPKFSFKKNMKNACASAAIVSILLMSIACDRGTKQDNTPKPFLQIENGQFEVNSVYLKSDIIPVGQAMGSGFLSFNFSGDTAGTFSASGPLISNQAQNVGVGAFIVRVWDEDYFVFREGLSLLGFYPKDNTKADVFVLGTKTDVLLDSIKAGNIYGIGPSNRFNGLFLTGIKITDFWKGEKNFIKAADRAFIIQEGLIGIESRDSTHIAGIFSGTTDASRSPLSKPFLLH